METTVKPDGNRLTHTYDPLGRLHTLCSSKGEIAFDYAYDNHDRIVEVKSLEGVTKRTYDIYGNLIQERLSNGLTLASAYNPHGERLLFGEAEFSYLGGMLHKISYQGQSYTYGRNLAGKIVQADTPIGPFHYTFDASLRQNEIITPYYTAKEFAFDPCGNLLSYTFTDSICSFTKTYEYDALNQLISESGHTYAYDSLYNCVEKEGRRCTLNTLSQLVSDGETRFEYDPNGNLIRAGETTCAFDSLDRLISVHKDESTYTYTYDPFNRRVAKNEGDHTTFYLWDLDNEIGSTERELRILGEGLGAEIGAAVFIELYGQLYTPIHDHRGNLVHLNGNAYRYTAY
ncbi:MAG: RHS repeat protein [Chlamydiales bacterium]|nr:RHS repeat protein [Chlamydiales bacterium]